MSEKESKEFDEMLDDVMGGILDVNDLSPDSDSDEENSLEANENAAPESKETFDPYGDEEESFDDDSAPDDGKEEKTDGTPEKTDSVPKENETSPDAEKAALQEKITNYEKRLHDTQSAMHKANEERAKLQKELDELKKKNAPPAGDGEDNWFSAEDDLSDKKSAELASKIENLEKQQKQFREEQAIQKWLAEADAFAKEHEDFDALVSDKLNPLLDEENGDPAVWAAYQRWPDKSPAGAYEFAKTLFAVENKPAGEPEQKEQEVKRTADPTKGKAGLDRINSADFSDSPRYSRNMIDEVFG